MAYKIHPDKCIACGACLDECPVQAISQGEDFYSIAPELCIDCDRCEPVCPVEAISGPDKD
ncbi:MAG: 4Fe-4S binding protein [Bacteroidota bacterium]|nr:4Fe-4S binding protein [Bacteroidota bacterium]